MNEELAQEILKNISQSGSVEAKVKPIIGGNLNHVLSLSSGSPRLQTNVIKRFNLILSQPRLLEWLNPFEIRCAFCRRVISYPCWYYNIKYVVNHFHYFICFDKDSSDKPSVKCYKRG